jgi:hypothetical protein
LILTGKVDEAVAPPAFFSLQGHRREPVIGEIKPSTEADALRGGQRWAQAGDALPAGRRVAPGLEQDDPSGAHHPLDPIARDTDRQGVSTAPDLEAEELVAMRLLVDQIT